MSAHHGSNWIQENEALDNKRYWLFESILIYLYAFNLENDHFQTKK